MELSSISEAPDYIKGVECWTGRASVTQETYWEVVTCSCRPLSWKWVWGGWDK